VIWCVRGTPRRPVIAEVCPGIREQFVGHIEGLSWDEMGERFPGLRERYIGDWSHTTPPGGESPEVMMSRVSACVDEIVARGEDTLMVAHFGSLSLAMVYLGVVSEEDALKPEWTVGQGTYTAIRIEDGRSELIHFNR
jgi:broad specificity phosphatase PhoE